MKVVMLLEEVENLEFNHVGESYKRCLRIFKSAELYELGMLKVDTMKIGDISKINLEGLNPTRSDYANKNSNSLSKDGEEEQIPIR